MSSGMSLAFSAKESLVQPCSRAAKTEALLVSGVSPCSSMIIRGHLYTHDVADDSASRFGTTRDLGILDGDR